MPSLQENKRVVMHGLKKSFVHSMVLKKLVKPNLYHFVLE